MLINEATESLIDELRGSPISAEEIIRWQKDDPRSWKLVLEWLTTMDVEVNVN